MPSLLDLRRRIRAVKSTQQITKAMKMISASKLRRAQDRVVGARPFALQMQRVLNSLASRVDPSSHPLLAERDPGPRDRPRGRGSEGPAHRRHCGQGPVRRLQHQHHQSGERVHQQRRRAGLPWARRPQRARLLQTQGFRDSSRGNRDLPARQVCRREAHRRGRHRGIHERPRVEGLHRLQRVQVGHAAAGRDGAVAADSEGWLRGLTPARLKDVVPTFRSARRRRLLQATSTTSTSPGRRRSSASCCRSTSRFRCTVRCSSRPPPSTPRA